MPVYGSAYGVGTGEQLVVCDMGSYIDIVPIKNCTSNPNLESLCSHARDIGVRCSPGQCKLY